MEIGGKRNKKQEKYYNNLQSKTTNYTTPLFQSNVYTYTYTPFLISFDPKERERKRERETDRSK